MRRVSEQFLRDVASNLPSHECDEMAVPSYLHRNPALRFVAWRRVEVMAQRLTAACSKSGAKSMRTILDFGCGAGVLLGESARWADRVIGVDLVLEPARKLLSEWSLTGVELFKPDEAQQRIAPGSVDVIVAAEVLEHVEPLEPTLSFLRTCLKPDGRLLVSLPTETPLYRFGRKLAGFSGHYHHENASSVDRALTQAGFKRLRREYVPMLPPFDIYWVLDYELDSA